MTRHLPEQPHVAKIAALAWPILIGQLAVIANSVIDTMMTSRYSATDLASLALGSSIYVSIFFGLNGILQALTPTIGQLFGAQKFSAIGHEVKQGVWLAFFLTCIGCVFLLYPHPILSLSNPSPELEAKAVLYLRTLAFALPATLGFVCYTTLNLAIGRPKMVMALQILALTLKIPLNAFFIFGGFGFPALGGPGCALASTLIAWIMLAIGWMILRSKQNYQIFGFIGTGFVAPNWATIRSLLKLGIPTGLSYFIEVTSFVFMALFIARLGDTMVAGHQISANFGAVVYMLPLSIASATGTLVAQSIGAGNLQTARQIGYSGVWLATILSGTIGFGAWLARDVIVRIYTPNEAIIATALPLFIFIGFYQLFDAVQIAVAFVLRAYKVALIPTLMNAIVLWGVGLGGGCLLGFNMLGIVPPSLQGAAGFWFSNSLSLVILSIGLLWYLRIVQRKLEKQFSRQSS